MTEKMRVVLSGLLFPMTMLHYFWRALERRDDIELFVTGPFFGDRIPWNNWITLPRKYVKYPDLPLPEASASMSINPLLIEAQLPEHMKNPDLWLQVDAGWHLASRPNAKVVAHVQTDPHVLAGTYVLPKSYSDYSFNMQGPYLQPYEHYLPYGFDREIHYPEDNVQTLFDACLIGLHYETRTALVNRLRELGLRVHYSIGEIYDDYRHIYNQSTIALSWSSKEDLCARNWEALAMKRLLIANRVPDMGNWFVEKEHYLGFSNLQEAVSKVQWAMENPEQAQAIADAGYRKVQPHTWDNRVTELLTTCKLI